MEAEEAELAQWIEADQARSWNRRNEEPQTVPIAPGIETIKTIKTVFLYPD